MMERNMRSTPMEVSMTYGVYDSLVVGSKYLICLPENFSCCDRSKLVREWMPSTSLNPNGMWNSMSVAALA